MAVLVTGGGGYLGVHVVRECLERGWEVRIFDRFCFGQNAVAELVSHPNCEAVQGDVRRLQEHPGLLDGVTAVVHLGGLSNDMSCDLNEEMAFDVNVESTAELAELAAQSGVTRFVLGSSCNVYGKGVFEFLDEQSPTNPVSTFGRTKVEAEKKVLAFNSNRFEPVVARVATMFGWSERMRFDLAVNQMAATAARQQRINVMGGGNQWRPFIHVADAARAIGAMLAAPREAVNGEIFNVGSDEMNLRISALAERVAVHFPGVEIVQMRSDDDLRSYHVRFEKLAHDLSFTCAYSLDDGVREVRDRLAELEVDPMSAPYINVETMRALLDTPVDEGGEPIASKLITLAKPSLGEEEENAIIETVRSGWLATGARVQSFEKQFADLVGAHRAVAVTSCTAALHLCLHHLGVGAGDEVITTPLTWASIGNTIINMGAKPVFVDIDPGTLNLDPAGLDAAITDRTKAIMPVHLAGQPCQMDEVRAAAENRGVPVVEDAAHALGASYHGTPIGSDTDYACFSFYAIKNITTIEGGIIAVRDPEAADRLNLLASNGMSANAWQRYGRSAAPQPPEVVVPGYKYRMGDVNAAIGLEQLKKFETFRRGRQRLARLYYSVLEDVDEISLPTMIDDVVHAWHLLIVRLDLSKLTKTRDEVAQALRRENVATGVHFLGLHLHKYYRETLGYDPDSLPHATKASYEILSLPLHPAMSDKNVHDVVAALKKVLTHSRKS